MKTNCTKLRFLLHFLNADDADDAKQIIKYFYIIIIILRAAACMVVIIIIIIVISSMRENKHRILELLQETREIFLLNNDIY